MVLHAGLPVGGAGAPGWAGVSVPLGLGGGVPRPREANTSECAEALLLVVLDAPKWAPSFLIAHQDGEPEDLAD